LLAAAKAEQAAGEAQAALEEREAHDACIAQEPIVERPLDADFSDQDLFQPSSINQSEALSPAESERAFAERYGSTIHTQPATPVMPQFAARTREMHLHQTAPEPEPTLEDLWASSLVEPRALLPSKLIEFPRELVSSRRARPRSPENPAVETSPAIEQPEPAQLRIFEVQPDMEQGNAAELAAETLTERTESIEESNPLLTGDAIQKKSSGVPQVLSQNPIQGLPQSPAVSGVEDIQHSARSRAGAATPVRTTTSPSAGSAQRAAYASNSSAARAFKGLEWAAISLDKEPAVATRRPETSVADYVPFLVDPASIDRRLMAFAVDFAAVTAGFLAFLLVFVASTPHLPSGITAIVLAGAVYASLWVLYQMLFFSLSGATAGMLYARIALCTFDDQNPSRPALRRRLGAWWLSCLPLGIGFLWCFVDEDNLGWHDRMTRMYQREY
jgi:uncharacterized RDD family membrane protein YckC